MRPTQVLRALVVVSAAASSACVAQAGPTEEVGQASAAQLGVDEFLYFRSNATGWGVDETTRLSTFVPPSTFARLYNVTQTWMITNGDQAIVTETNQLDGWGTSQAFFHTTTPSITVPSTDPLAQETTPDNPNFTIAYRVLGEHRVIVNFAQTPPTIEVQSEADVCSGVCPDDLVCSLIPPLGIPTCAPPPGQP
jgi:hypothetical protein